MALGRRAFVKQGLLATGAAASASAGLLAACGGEQEKKRAQAVLAMTPDGDLEAPPVEVPGLPVTDPMVRRGVPGRKWVQVIDLAACDGCGKCITACNAMHNTPADRTWIRIFKLQDAPDTAPYWFPRSCFQCDNPPCTRVCPVDATFKRQDGIVLIDNERCIGCRFCMAACPYSARVFNWGHLSGPDVHSHAYSPEQGHPRRIGTVEKCDFCPEVLARGELPPCAANCEMDAVYFGDENEDAVTNHSGQTFRLSKLLRDRGGYRHLEELGTEPRVYYLPPVHRRYPAPGEKEGEGSLGQAGAGT
jgi:molybdopterin-containing oxidoreductase family iron-sulfur binding subunit